MQNTSHLLMIRPVAFEYNEQTAINNAFQVKDDDDAVGKEARLEFDGLVNELVTHGIDVTVIKDTPEPHTPDSIFPNNWVSFHENGKAYLYPMFAENRRPERKPQVLESIREKFDLKEVIDLSVYEQENRFLEGTGSFVLDRENKIAYACLSPRTDPTLLRQWCGLANYSPVIFTATDDYGNNIYHTNVMMCVAHNYVVICLQSIQDINEREFVTNTIKGTGKEIIELSLAQLNHFAGNMLQVQNQQGDKFLVMSSQALQSFSEEQLKTLETYNPIISSNLETIERNGGGSARCMLAEIFLPLKEQ